MSKSLPAGLLKPAMRVGLLLAELSADDAALVVLHHVETMGLHETKAWRLFLDRNRKAAGKPAEPDMVHKTESDRKTSAPILPGSGQVPGGFPVAGGKGGSDSRISDPESTVSIPESFSKLSLPEGGPSKRFNPAALVEHFVAGVNEAGGVWTCAGGKPFTDLSAALQPWASKAGNPLGQVRVLGGRWFAYCGRMPRDAWKAASWLGEGAPERQAKPGEAIPLTEAQERRAKALRAESARKRDEEYEREKASWGPPTPETMVQMRGLVEGIGKGGGQ